jgi:esterase/lipase superfamily enzyme
MFIACHLAIMAGCATTPPAPIRSAPAEQAPPPSTAPAPSLASTPIEIFFTTNRIADPDPERFYDASRGEISYGVATVGIPADHVIGRHEEPSLLKLEWTRDDNKHIKIRTVEAFTRDEFLLRVRVALEASAGEKLMVFVPGYNADFAGATMVVGQFATDLKFNGPVILFSWPSHGRTASYAQDETNAEWAAEHFVELLKLLQDEASAEAIYLVGHSMGNRILGRGVTTLASDRPNTDFAMFREIVMIAPDIDADVFSRDMAPRIARTGIHTTLYASSNDRALKASKLFHGYARAGEAGDGLVVVDGVETVDASERSGGLLGHSYFSEDHRIMEDIFALLQSGQRADNRFNLRAVDLDGKRHWQFRK